MPDGSLDGVKNPLMATIFVQLNSKILVFGKMGSF
jgi:hypothetical protein